MPITTPIRVFQFLIGWLQTRFRTRRVHEGRAVSIPHRLATNGDKLTVYPPRLSQVSIPHRLATNEFSGLTYIHCIRVSIPHRLATNLLLLHKQYWRQVFQFLIGWLQTKVVKEYVELRCRVSIPHRLATNLYDYQKTLALERFQFLIGWLQTFSSSLAS